MTLIQRGRVRVTAVDFDPEGPGEQVAAAREAIREADASADFGGVRAVVRWDGRRSVWAIHSVDAVDPRDERRARFQLLHSALQMALARRGLAVAQPGARIERPSVLSNRRASD